MKRTLKKGISLLLMAAMLLSLFPAEAFAVEGEQIGEVTAEPTEVVSAEPSPDSTPEPSVEPSGEEVGLPTEEPSTEPSEEPTEEPSTEPTEEPSEEPTEEPSAEPTDEPSTEPSEEDTVPEESLPDEDEEGEKPGDDVSDAILKNDSWVSIDPETNEVSYSLHLTGLPVSDLVRFTIVVVNKTPDGSGVRDTDYEIWGNDDNMHPNTATNARLAMGAGNTYAPYWYLAVSITTGAGDNQYIVSKKEAGQGEDYHEVKLNFVPGDSYKTVAESLANAYGDLTGPAEYELILHSDNALGTDADPTQGSRRVKVDATVSAGRPILTGPSLVTIDTTDFGGIADALFGRITNIGSASAQVRGLDVDDAEHTIDDYFFYRADDEDLNPWISEDASTIIAVNGYNDLRIGSNIWDDLGENTLPIEHSSYPTSFNVIINYTAEGSDSPEYQLTIPVTVVQSQPSLQATIDVYVYSRDTEQTINRSIYNTGSLMGATGGTEGNSNLFAESEFNFTGDSILTVAKVSARNIDQDTEEAARGTQEIKFSLKVPPKVSVGDYTGTFTFPPYAETEAKVVFNVHVLPAPRAKLEDETITISSQEVLSQWMHDMGATPLTYFIKNSGDGVATITGVRLGSTTSGYDDIPTVDNESVLGLTGKTVVGSPSNTSFSVDNFWDGSDIQEGYKYEQKIIISYKDAFSDEFGEAAKTATITFRIDIGKNTTSAVVTVNKNGLPWTAAGEGFSAPTRVAIANTAPSGATAGTTLVSARATIADLELSTPYNVYVYRDSTWERVGTWTSGSGDSSNCVVNYYTATVTLTGSAGGSNGSSISAISGTNSLATGTVTDGRSLLFGTVEAATTFGNASFTVKKGTGETITRTSISGVSQTTPNDTTVAATGSYSFTMPNDKVEIAYAAAPSTYTYTLTLNKDKAAWNNATSVTMMEGSTPAPGATHTAGTNTYSWTLTHGHTYTITVSDSSLANTYTESTGTITGAVNKTLDFFTVNLAVAAVSGATHGSVGFAANPTATSASKVYPAGATVNIYAAPDSQYAFGGWTRTAGAGSIASAATANTTYKIGTAAQETGAITLTASFSQSQFDASLALTLNGQAVTALTSDITAITIGGTNATYDGTDGRWEVANLAAGTHTVNVTASGRTYNAGSVSIASPNATYALYSIEVADGAGNVDTHPAITQIGGNNTTGSPTKVVVPANVAVTLAPNASTGYTANGHWSATVAAGAATDINANSYTISAADATAIDAATNTGHAGVVLTPQFTWAVTIKTVNSAGADVTGQSVSLNNGTAASGNGPTYTFSGLTVSTDYKVWVNGFESSVEVKSETNAGATVNVTLYTVSTATRNVTNASAVTPITGGYTHPSGETAPSAKIALSGNANLDSVYVPVGATGTLPISASNGGNTRYTAHTTLWSVTSGAGSAAATTYTLPTGGIAANTTVSANFIPSHKITIATSKRPNGAAGSASAATASITVNGDTLANGGVTYVQIANANGTSATFAVTDPTTTNTAYVSPGDWEAAAAFGGTAGAYTTTADATVTPIFALEPTLSPASRSYDIGAGASSQTLPVYTWTKNDAVQMDKIEIKKSTEDNTAYATLAAANYTVSGANYTLKADYLRTLDNNTTYNLRFVSTTDGKNTDRVANLVISSTAANLTKVDIKNDEDNSTTVAASGDDLVYVSHVDAKIRPQDLSWTWYRSQTKPTAGTHSATPDASWTEVKAAEVGTAGGNTYKVTDADKGYYVFALVTASVTGTGTVVTNALGVKYEINVKTVNSAGTNIGAATSSPTAVHYTTNGGTGKTTVAYDTTENAFVATGLIPGNTYNFYTNAVGGKTGTSDPFVKAADKTHTDRSDVTVTYYTVSTDDITADNGKYSSVGFTSGGSYYADGSVTGVGITAAVGSTAVAEGGYVLAGQSAVFTAADWTKDYTLAFSQTMGTNAKAALDKATGSATNQKRVSAALVINGDTTVDGVLSMNFHNVAAHVMGSGAVTEMTLTLTDDGKTYIFTTAATDAPNNKFNGVGGTAVTAQMTATANSPQTFSLPRGTYAAGSTVPATTTLNGYRKPHSTGSAAYNASLNVTAGTDASFDIGTTDTSLVLDIKDSYSGSFSPTTAVTGSASYTSGVTHDGTMARTVTLPYQYAAQTIGLTLTNSNSSTGTMSDVTIGAITGNGTGKPVVSVGTAVSNATLNKGANKTSSLAIAASNDVAPGTYTYTVEMSFTEKSATPKVTYTLTIVVEEGRLIDSTIKQNSDTATVVNKQHAKVGDTLNFDNFVAQKLTNYNGTYGTATYTGGKTNFTETTDYTYQWQKSTNGGTSWSDITGATNATYTIAAGDANSDIRLLVKSVAGGKLIEEAPSPYVSVGYNAQVTVRVDGTAIANNSDGYTVVLHPNGVAANVTTGDVPLTFTANGVFSTDDSAALVRGTTYNVVVKNGTYATAKNTTLPASYNINGTNTSRTVDYYTVKYRGGIAAAQRYEYVTGSGETFATDPAITAVVAGDSNKAIETGKTVLAGENVRFGTSWTQDYSIKWMQTRNGDAITTNDVEMTTALSGTKSENLTHSYNLVTNTIYATLTQKTYTVTGVVKDVDGGTVASITNAKLTGGSEGKTIVYTTGAAAAGEFNKNNSNLLGTGKHNGTVTFVVPKGDYTLNSTIGASTTFKGYSDQTKTTPDASFAGVKNVTANGDRFRIYIQGENAAFKDITDKNHTLYFAYDTGIPAAQAVSSDFVNGGNTPITVTEFKVYKDGNATALADLSGEPVTFTLPTITDANKTLAVNNAASKLTVTIAPKVGQTNDTDATYRIEATGETPAGTTITKSFTYNFKVNPVTVASANIGGTAKLGEATPLSASYTVNPINQANATNNNTDQTAVTGKLTDADVGYAWFRSTNGSLTKTAFDYANKTLNGTNPIGTNSTYAVQVADDGQFIYLVVYGKASAADTKDAANAYGYELNKVPVYYTGAITVKLDGTTVATTTDSARYKVKLVESGTNREIATAFDDASDTYKSVEPLDTTKTYTIWATRSTKEVGTPNWINAGKTITNTKRSETIDYYTTDYEPNATVTDRGNGITTETTLTGPIAGAVSAEIKGTAVSLDPTDAVLSGTQVTFKYDKTAADATTGTARHWSDTTIQPHYKMTWGGSAATPAAAYGAVADKDLTVTEKITKVTASLGQETYTITFEVRGNGGTVDNPTLTVATGKGIGSRVATTSPFNTTTNKTVTFSNMPAGDYTLTSTAGSETVIVSYVYGPESTKTTTQIKDTTNTHADVKVTKASTGNQINIEASTYIVGWYEKGTAADWSDKKVDTSENLGSFVYGYAAPTEIERRLYNVGNTDIPALKITSGSPNAVVTYTDKGGADVTTAVTTGAGVTLPVGDYIVAKITTATGKDANTTAYSSTLTASSSKTLTPDTGNSLTFTPSYTVGVATIDAYDLSMIAAPANGTALDTVTGKTQKAKLDSESDLRDSTGTAAIISVGTTTLTWAPPTTPAAAGTVYTVTVVANAINNNYVFDTTLTGYTLNGAAPTSRTLSNNNRTLTLTYTFPATAPTVVAVTATATGGYTATGTITANATSTVNQEMFWVVVPQGTAAPDANAIINAATAGTWVDYGSGDAIYAGGEWGLRGFDIDGGLQPGTDYTIYATSRNKANTDAVGNVAHADFKTWYRVEVVTNPTSGAGTITAPAVATTPAGDNGKHVVYVADGSSTNLSASVNTGVTYVFGSWTETAPVGQTGAVAIGTNMTNQSFTPTKNTTVYANFTAKAALDVTGSAGTTTITVNTTGDINVVSDDTKVTNVGTGRTTGNVVSIVAAAGTTWNPASLPAVNNAFTVTGYVGGKIAPFDPAHNEGFGVSPSSATVATEGTYRARVFFYDAGEPAIYDYIDVELNVVAAGAATFAPMTHTHDLYAELNRVTPAHADWNITITHNGYDLLNSIQVKTKPASDTTTALNTDIATSLYTFTAGTTTHTLALEEFVKSVATNAKAGDRYTLEAVLGKTGETNTSSATLTLNFTDTTPHITAAGITQTSAVTGTPLNATATHPTTYNPKTADEVRYQWYRTDSATVTPSWTQADNAHEEDSIWTWTGATAITGATSANYTATAADAGHYLYVVAVGDADGDYVRDGAVSATVYVRPTVTVVIDGQGDGYGRVQIGTNTANSTNKRNDPKTDTVAAGGTIDVTAAANSGYYFTGWKLNDGTAVVSTASPYTVTPTGDTTVHANFDKLPTLTADTRFDTSGTTNSVSFTYTKNDGSGHVEIIIGNNVVKVAGNISGSTFSGTLPTGVTFNGTALTLTKDWIVANLPSSGNSTGIAYDVKINDLDKDPNKQGDPRSNPYDTAVKLTVATDSYTVTSFTDKQTDGKWNGKYLGTVKTGGSAASVLDSGNGNSVASVQAGNTVTLVATPRAGYAFKQWTVMEGDDPATTANAKGYFGTPGTLTSTSATATFHPTANVEVRAEFEPITFNITSTPGYVEYAATSMATTPSIRATATSGTQHFTYAVATQAEVTAAGNTWNARDDAALPAWLALSAAGVVSFTGPATGVNVEKAADGTTDLNDELSVWVKVTSDETGEVKYAKLQVNVQPSQLSFDVTPTYPTIYVGDSVSTTGIATVNAINNITPVAVSTRANGWKEIEWTIEGRTATDLVGAAIPAPGTYTYDVTASWDPDDTDEQYNYLPVSTELKVTAMPTSHLFGFVKEEGSTTPIHSDTDTAIYLDGVGNYDYFLRNIKDKLYKVTVTAASTSFDVHLKKDDGTIEAAKTSFNIGDMETLATVPFVFTPKSGTNFTVGEYKVTLTASGYPRADSPEADKMTQTFEFTYKVNPKPISIVEIEKLDLTGITVGDSVTTLWTQNSPSFTDVSGANKYSYSVNVSGSKNQTLTDSLIGIRTRNSGVADKYNQTPYTMEYRWNGVGSSFAAGDNATLEVTLQANENYVFTAEPGDTTTTYEFDYNDGADQTATGAVSNSNRTLKFTVGPIKPLLKNIDVRVTQPSAGSTPGMPDYANATHKGYVFDADAVGGASYYQWFKLGDGDAWAAMTAADTFELGNTYKVVIHVDRNETDGKWVPNDQIITAGNGSRLPATGTNNAVHSAMDTTITLQWTLQQVTPPSPGPSPATLYEVNYIIVPGGNSPDPLMEEVEAGGYPEHVPHVTPNNNDEYQFIGWMLEDPTGKEIKDIVPNLLVKPETYKINQDTDFYAVYGLREVKVTYELGSFGKTDDPTQEIVARYAYPSFTPNVTIVDQYKDRAKFVGWSIEKPDHALVVNLVDPLTTQIINDTVFYAVYEIDEYDYHEHYMIGYPNGEFRPEGKITRAEVATIIARAVLPDFIEFNDYGDGGYSDVAGHWAQSGIAFCSNAGVFVGYEDGTFRPNKPITREEYALVIARIQGLTGCDDRFVMPFKDVEKVSGWALDGVYTCYDEGWIDGYEDENELGTYTFAPQRDIGRAEAAKIMNGYLNRGVDEAGVSSLNEYIQFPDVPDWYWGYWEVAEAVNDHYYYYYLEDEDGADVPPEEWIVEAGYLNVKVDENDPDNTKNVRRSDPVYVNAN